MKLEVYSKWIHSLHHSVKKQALAYHNAGEKVVIHYNNEAGNWQASICVDQTDFWMESFPRTHQAVKFCQDMGWVIKEIIHPNK